MVYIPENPKHFLIFWKNSRLLSGNFKALWSMAPEGGVVVAYSEPGGCFTKHTVLNP